MFVSGPAILSALFLIQAEAQFEAGARIESRVGQAPSLTSSNQAVPPEQTQVMVVATPLLRLRWIDGIDDLHVDSATRILWRPVPLFDSRPLFLETLGATHLRRPSRRSQLQLNVRASYGEQDYTSLQQQLPNQPSLPLAMTMLMVDATADASRHSSRRTTLTLQLGAMHSRSFDTQGVSSGTTGTFALPTQTTVTAAPGLTYALARRSTLNALVSIIDTDSQGILYTSGQTGQGQTGELNALSIQPQVGVRQELTRQHQLHLAVGFAYTVALRQTDAPNLTRYPVPLLQLDLNSVLLRARTTIVRSTLGAGTTAFVDPVFGVAVTRGLAQASVDAQLGPWSVGARCAFSTDLFGRLPTIGGSTPGETIPDETFVTAEIPVRYRASRHLIVEFGGRYTERAPYLGAPGFAWHYRELWLYLSLTTFSRPSSTRS
jgi:hypothetical protein